MPKEAKEYRCRDPKCVGKWRSKLRKGRPAKTQCPVCSLDLITGLKPTQPPTPEKTP
jgi:hypothetical protein